VALTKDFGPDALRGHVVHFYDQDRELGAAVGPYLAETIRAGGAAVVIATEVHRRAFVARLAAAGVNPELAEAGLRPTGAALVMIDAGEIADALLGDGHISPHRFDTLIGDLIREAAAGGRPVRAYGEIVARLWADGHVTAALELEELWNELGRELEFYLYCAYPVGLVSSEGDAGGFREVCRLHSALVGPPLTLAGLQGPSEERTATFRWSSLGPAEARRFVRETLADWGRADLSDDAALIATELATNAVLHARSDFTVTLSAGLEGSMRIAVADASLIRPRPRQARPLDGSGRGLGLIEALATSWGADLLPDGKVVWAQLGS
jgi:MEDS: MEthanogen/methylotroph, DcmR Sensory domain